MQRFRFNELPALAQAGIALSFFNSWVLVAEFVIDRYGLDDRLPLYRKGDVCVWDLTRARAHRHHPGRPEPKADSRASGLGRHRTLCVAPSPSTFP
jgi:hypothetical protein